MQADFISPQNQASSWLGCAYKHEISGLFEDMTKKHRNIYLHLIEFTCFNARRALTIVHSLFFIFPNELTP